MISGLSKPFESTTSLVDGFSWLDDAFIAARRNSIETAVNLLLVGLTGASPELVVMLRGVSIGVFSVDSAFEPLFVIVTG